MPTTTLAGGPTRSPAEIDKMATVMRAFDPLERELVSIGALPAAGLGEEE